MSDIDDYLESLNPNRRARIEHFLKVIDRAEPGLSRQLWSYGGGVIGLGHYHYRYASGREGEFFMMGVGDRKRYIAIYANGAIADGFEDGYLAESFKDRFPGCKVGKSCIQVPDKAAVSDEALEEITRRSVAYFRNEMQKPKDPKSMQIWE